MHVDKGTDVVVVGAGAVGLSVAVGLAERGRRVTVLDRDLPGAQSTTRTGGGIRQQFATELGVRMSLLSAPAWEVFSGRTGVDLDLREVGYLFLARTSATAAALAAQLEVQAALGIDAIGLTGEELVRRWGHLDGRGFVAGAFRRRDGWADHHRIVDGLTRQALAAGVGLRVGDDVVGLVGDGPVTGVRTAREDLRADVVVLATGAEVGLAAQVGVDLPVRGHRHELLVADTRRDLPEAMPWMIDVDGQVHQRPDLGSRVLIGGFLGHDDPAPDVWSLRADPGWIDQVRRAASDAFG